MMKRCFTGLAALVAVLAFGPAARAEFQINELLFNPPGGDNGQEFLEIRSDAPGASLAGVWFLAIEGEGGVKGIIDQAVNLSSFATGSNGLFLLRDAATSLVPAPEPATTLAVMDFVPDIENGSNTFLLVRGFTGAVGDDLDLDNDGIAEVASPWTSILHGFSWIDPDGTDATYFDSQIEALNPGGVFGDVGFTAEGYFRFNNGPTALFGIRNDSGFPGPYIVSGAEYASTAPFESSAYIMTPGGVNVEALPQQVVPEPSSVVALTLALGLVAGSARLRRLARLG